MLTHGWSKHGANRSYIDSLRCKTCLAAAPGGRDQLRREISAWFWRILEDEMMHEQEALSYICLGHADEKLTWMEERLGDLSRPPKGGGTHDSWERNGTALT